MKISKWNEPATDDEIRLVVIPGLIACIAALAGFALGYWLR